MPLEQIAKWLGASRFADFSRRLSPSILHSRSTGVARTPTHFPRGPSCLHQSVVHPVGGHRAIVKRLTLRNFVFMMGKHEVEAPAVDVKVWAQNRPAHRGTLDVPARSARAPWAFPGWLICFSTLPQGKISSRSLTVGSRTALALRALDGAVGELAVVGILGDIEIDIPFGCIGKTLSDEFLNKCDDRVDVFRRLGHHIDRLNSECG